MKQVDFSLGLKWNEKQMSWRVTESVCVLSARPMWVMALIWPPAPRLFIILRWQGGAGKRGGLGAPPWSITPEVSFPSYLTATWITAALVYRRQPIWMSSGRRKRFLRSLYQSRWVIGEDGVCRIIFFCASGHMHTLKKKNQASMYASVHTQTHTILLLCEINGGWREKETIDGECKAERHAHRRISLCVAQFISLHELHSFLLSCFFFALVIWASMCCQCIQEWAVIWEKEIIYVCGGQRVLYWGYSITHSHILNRKCRLYIYSCFWKENLNKDGYFFSTCSISFHHLCWDIPGSPWQGRMCRFPFQTGLSCPSHHQGSLLKYIPSVKAWG